MRTADPRKILLLLAVVLLPSLLAGQVRRSVSPTRSVDRDLRVWKMQMRLDSIRRHRPTVALVLSGGGAKGAAHVGVLKYLESAGIPVDMVLGTSMGGLVGGIYAMGFDADHLERIIRNIDWNQALSDDVPRDYLSYSRTKYKEKYALSFPFFYSSTDFLQQMKDDYEYTPAEGVGEIHLGAGEADATGLVKDNLLGSLPSGMVFGQNVSNLFSALTVGYQDRIDFYDLPIPFLCVAADLVTGEAKIWTEGKLNTALRSTMSIPGLFAPVRTNGMVLVDGGIRNNYPTDLAKRLGADIIIGVDLSQGFRKYAQINNLGGIIDAGVDMLGRNSYEQNKSIPDVSIRPDMDGYGMMSFDAASIDTLIRRGYEAAEACAASLDSVRNLIHGATPTPIRNRPALDLGESQVLVDGVEIVGVNDDESAFLMKKLKLQAGQRMGSAEIEDAVATVFGTNAFDYVNYELLGKEEPFRLRFSCKKGPINQLGVGARFDTEEIVSVLVNLGVGVHKIQGTSLDFTGKIGVNPSAAATFAYATSGGYSVGALASLRYTDKNMISIGDNRFRINFTNIRQEVFLSNLKWSKFFVKAGARNDYFNVSSMMAEQVIGDYDMTMLTNDYLSVFADLRSDTFDNGYLPTKGSSVGLNYSWVFGGGPRKVDGFHTLSFDARKVVGKGGFFAFIPSFNLRFLVGEEIPVPYTNVMGGSMAGRYLEQQIPFIGVNNAIATRGILAVARTDFRFRLMKNNYLTAIANYALSADEPAMFYSQDDYMDAIGVGLQYTYHSIIGPISANLHWSDVTGKVGAYISVGFDF